MKALDEYLVEEFENCKNFLYNTALKKNPTFKELMEINEKDLPTHLNKDDWEGEVIKYRIDDKEIPPSILIEILSNCEFSYDDYRNLGKNDGRLEQLSSLFDFLQDKEKSLEVLRYVYGE